MYIVRNVDIKNSRKKSKNNEDFHIVYYIEFSLNITQIYTTLTIQNVDKKMFTQHTVQYCMYIFHKVKAWNARTSYI